MSTCYAAEMMWDEDGAKMFRQFCRDSVGRDCVCQEGGPCWLAAAVLEGVVPRRAGMAAFTTAGYEALNDDRKHQLADLAAQLMDEQRAAKV